MLKPGAGGEWMWGWGSSVSERACACRIKNKKENQRRVEEQKLQEVVEQQEPSLGEGANETLAQLKLEERKVKEKQRNKECARYGWILSPHAEPGFTGKDEYFLFSRYIEALRAQIREKIKLFNIDLPPLCSCGADFWDSHPDTCANNCVFYKNHKGKSSCFWILDRSGRNPTWRDVSLLLRDDAPTNITPERENLVFCCFFS